MKVLLVDDSDEKAAHAERVLLETISTKGLKIDRARCFLSGIRSLELETYDLLILDLVLPLRNGETPSAENGKNILAEVVEGANCRRPSHIICLTAFEDQVEVLRGEVNRNLFHLVVYKETEIIWREALATKATYVSNRLKEATILPINYNVDVAIVTSSPMVELSEVKRLPGTFVSEYHQCDNLDYYSSTWPTEADLTVSVVACAAPRMGMTAACVTACKVINRWKPRYLVMTGIAAGTKKAALSFGDVLVAEAAYDYGSGKILETERGKRVFVPSPSPLPIDATLFAILQRWEREQLHMDSIRNGWSEQIQVTPRLVLGIIASGAAVVQSESLVAEILSTSRKVVGIDMEAYALFQAAYLSQEPRPKVLVAKAVCDFANKEKDDNWQRFAAFTSARWVYEFFTHARELNLGTARADLRRH